MLAVLVSCVLATVCAFTHRWGPVLQHEEPSLGVGFSLALDYAVSSVYFANNTFVDVAKITGGPAYRETMRRLSPRQSSEPLLPFQDTDPDNPFFQLFERSLREPIAFTGNLSAWSASQASHNSASNNSLELMLSALRAATEATIEVSVEWADVAAPFPTSNWFSEQLLAAASAIGLHVCTLSVIDAAGKAVSGHCDKETGTYDEDEWDQLNLSIDYSHAALTVTLSEGKCGDGGLHLRSMHDHSLGATALSRCRAENGDKHCHERLTSSLRDLVRKPLESDWGASWDHIENLVFLGDLAADGFIEEALREFLAEHAPGAEKLIHKARSSPVSPVFASARGLAEWNFRHLLGLRYCVTQPCMQCHAQAP